MRIVAGTWRGRALRAPPGSGTRPTADRVRQAVFDMLLHAEWGGREFVERAHILDAFAGTGALGLEGLSRGAVHATFVEKDRGALAALRANVGAVGAADRCTIIAEDVLALSEATKPSALTFLDPPYGHNLVAAAVSRLRLTRWLALGSVVVAEIGRNERVEAAPSLLSDRVHGAARLIVWRE